MILLNCVIAKILHLLRWAERTTASNQQGNARDHGKLFDESEAARVCSANSFGHCWLHMDNPRGSGPVVPAWGIGLPSPDVRCVAASTRPTP